MLNSAGCLQQMPTCHLCVHSLLGHHVMCCQGLMYCQGSVRTTGQADIWPGKTVVPLLLWCVVFVFGLVRFVRPYVMTKELFYSYPSMRSRKAMPVCYFPYPSMCSRDAMPVYSPQRPDMTITMQIHLSVLPDT